MATVSVYVAPDSALPVVLEETQSVHALKLADKSYSTYA